MDKLEILRPILNNKYGPCAKFLANYFIEVDKISKKVLIEGYQQKYQEFLKICDDFKASIKSDSFESSNRHETSPIPKKKNTDAALVEKFRTPMGKKSNGPVFNKKADIIDLISEEEQNVKQTKKRSALMAEISVLADENSVDEEETEEKDIKKPLFKDETTNTKKSKAIKTCKKHDNKKQSKDPINEDNNVQDDSYELVVTAKPESKKGKNPSKKLKTLNTDEHTADEEAVTSKKKVNEGDEEEIEEVAKTKKSKKKKNKISEIEPAAQEAIKTTKDKKEKVTKKGKKNKQTSDANEKTIEPEPTKPTLFDPKTPVAKDSQQRKSRLELLQSTVKKTIKKRPLTRRAAAQAAAAAAANVIETKESIPTKAPSTLKKVNKFESGITKPSQAITNDSSKTPLVHRNKAINNLLLTASKLKPNFRTSIDERKARTSQAKLEAKRKSVKKAQAILKSIQSERKSMSTNNNNNNLISDDDDDNDVEETKIKSTKLSIKKEKEIIENILKSSSPKIVIHKIPTSIINSSNISASKAASIADNQRRLTKDLLASNTIQQNYRVQPSQFLNKMMTPGKNAPPVASQNRASFIKFLERNTPSKLTKTENEEKQKAERAAKEAKEKERLQTIEKQKQEKLDIQKKIREEKMKKINEAKLKQEQEQEKKKLAIQQQQIQEQQQPIKSKMPLSSNSCMNLNQIKTAAGTSLSSSTSNLSTIKKPTTTQVLKPIYDQNDLSTFGNDFNTFKQINNQLKQSTTFNTDSMDTHHTASSYHHQQKNLCETTYVLNSPNNIKSAPYGSIKQDTLGIAKPAFTNYEVTPLQPPKLKNQDNYDVSGLGSEDDTDDEDDPSKPIPEWARDPQLIRKVQAQAKSMYNFTKVFKAASQSEINLENIFKTRRKKFTERSSSANWDSTPIWKSNGISGEESFWQFKKNY